MGLPGKPGPQVSARMNRRKTIQKRMETVDYRPICLTAMDYTLFVEMSTIEPDM